MEFTIFDAFKTAGFKEINSKALAVYAVYLRFPAEDLSSLESEILTDGPSDHGIDAIFIDSEKGYAIIIQAYYSEKYSSKTHADLNKAEKLNTAINFALHEPIEKLPERFKTPVTNLRNAIKDQKISRLEAWFVHNLLEKDENKEELERLTQSGNAIVKNKFSESEMAFSAFEVGANKLQEWYDQITQKILVKEQVTFEINGGYFARGKEWDAVITSVRAIWLYDMFKVHQDKLFSANVRSYLGSKRREKNINDGIKNTAEKEPDNFWVYNNGITILVNSFDKITQEELIVTGLSIVNGAQTTGAIGSLNKPPSEEALIPVRFVRCNKQETIEKIIRYNNSQNPIKAFDFRSNDAVQTRLAKEFDKYSSITYKGRRGGFEDNVSRPRNQLKSDTIAQVLAAYNLDPVLAYQEKAKIWEDDHEYIKLFNENTTAENIVFCVSLLRAIEKEKSEIYDIPENELTEKLMGHREFFRSRGATLLAVAAISKSLEEILGKKITQRNKLSFKNGEIEEAIENWKPIVKICMSFYNSLKLPLEHGVKNREEVKNSIETFSSCVLAVKEPNNELFKIFSEKIKE